MKIIFLMCVLSTIGLQVPACSQTARTGAAVTQNNMNKQKLAQRVEKIEPSLAAFILDENSELERVAAPFFKTAAIYKAQGFEPTRPQILFVGCDDTDFCAILNANPKGFFELAQKSPPDLGKKELRLDYLDFFFTVTNPNDERLLLLDGADDIKPRPNLSATETQQFKQFHDKYQKIIHAPTVSDNSPYKAVIFAVKGQNLIRIDAILTNDGKINLSETVLEKDLLIPYAL